MKLQNPKTTFVHNFWFVDPQEPRLTRAARSQSMREVYRVRKWLRTQSNQDRRSAVAAGALQWTKNARPPCERSSQDDDQPDREPMGKEYRNEQQILRPGSVLGAGQLDPFHGFPVPVDNREFSPARLIDFMLYGTGYYLCGVHPADAKFLLSKELFVIPSLQDPAPFSALCAVASWAWDRQHGNFTNVEALRHKQEAIRLINERIRGDIEISDQTILAVALLWKLEARFDDVEYLETHVDGLMQMISLRGGLGALNQRLQLVLAWLSSSQPGNFALPFYGPSEVEDSIISRLSPAAYFALCSKELIEILQSISSLPTRLQNSSHRTHAGFFKITKILHRLLSSATDERPGHFRGRPLLKSLCRLASLLWLHSLNIDYNDVFSSIESQIDQLHGRLIAHDLGYKGTVVMLWHVLLKQEGSIAVDNRAWHVVRVMSVVKRMSIELVDELADLLWVRLVNCAGHHDTEATELMARVREAIGCDQ